MAIERPDGAQRRSRPAGFPLGRFIIICAFIALVVITLGVFLLVNLFDDTRQFSPPDMASEVSQIGQRTAIKPPDASNQARIYYTSDGIRLIPSLHPIQPDSKASRGRQALEILLETDPEGALHSPVPPGVSLEAFYLMPAAPGSPREVVVDLSRAIADTPLGGVGAELLCVYSIVNTVLANTDGAEAVRILINGAPMQTLWGHVDISGALTPGALLAPAR